VSEAIETEGLTRVLGGRRVVDGLELQVPAGSVFGFLGQNGAGKTTTIRMLLGLLRPTCGRVRLFGRDLADDRVRAVSRVGSMVESPALYERLTGRENLDLTRRLLGAPRTEIDRVLEIVDLRPAADRLAGGYSLGMRQRLGLARALLGAPRLLVLDEPSNGLDPDGMLAMRRLLSALPGRSGATVFVSSHLLGEVEQIATHVGLMHQGRLLLQSGLAGLRRGMKGIIEVGTARASDAAAMPVASGFDASVGGPAALTVRVGAGQAIEPAAAKLNALLLGAGFQVFRLAAAQPSLEQIYLERLGAASAGHRREAA
jgi:ABC-2 type transport system ATP-binding protein